MTTNISDGSTYAPRASRTTERVVGPGEFRFAAAYLDHGHIYGQTSGLLEAGGTLTAVYDTHPERVAAFIERFPQARPVDRFDELLGDDKLHMIAAAAVPAQRAAIGLRVLRAGKDYFTDKSPFTTLEQLEQVRGVVVSTRRKYMVYYAERLHNEAAWHTGELIREGAVGDVLQVLILAPHRLSKASRPDWFFDKAQYGGIITDIGCHQVEQFLTYTGTQSAIVNFARVENFQNGSTPGLEDFGEFSLTADNGASCYARLDWFTPAGLPVWGDGRTFILGSDGTLEVRKYIDLARTAPAALILLANGSTVAEIDCRDRVGYPFFGRLIRDVLDRTETAMSQEHAFLAAEISMKAQEHADRRR
jgi:predicted dehydrogenase